MFYSCALTIERVVPCVAPHVDSVQVIIDHFKLFEVFVTFCYSALNESPTLSTRPNHATETTRVTALARELDTSPICATTSERALCGLDYSRTFYV